MDAYQCIKFVIKKMNPKESFAIAADAGVSLSVICKIRYTDCKSPSLRIVGAVCDALIKSGHVCVNLHDGIPSYSPSEKFINRITCVDVVREKIKNMRLKDAIKIAANAGIEEKIVFKIKYEPYKNPDIQAIFALSSEIDKIKM